MSGSTVDVVKRDTAELRPDPPKGESSFVRRLIAAEDDPARRRIRTWLTKIDDERLLSFGLTPRDIAILRGAPIRHRPR
jgi:hypothetical protein